MDLILSLFPGADLLGRGFESEGFCVVRGPDLVFGSDVRDFHAPPGVFAGVVGGPPCPDFSSARRSEPTGDGVAMLAEFCRVVGEAAPPWFLMENVPRVPDVEVPGYRVQRFNLTASECGGAQHRNRCFQFGSRDGTSLVLARSVTPCCSRIGPAALATEFSRPARRSFADFCELQGLPRSFDLPGLSRSAKYRAVGNGVPVYVARMIAKAIRSRRLWADAWNRLCPCECGRLLTGTKKSATPACRKRLERSRRAA